MFQERKKLHLLDSNDNTIVISNLGEILKSSAKNPVRKPIGYVLPDELVLKWTCTLPDLDEATLAIAINDQFRVNNPFPPGDLTTATYTQENSDKKNIVHFFLASRSQIIAHYNLINSNSSLSNSELVEIWHPATEQTLVNLPGFGEGNRLRRSMIQRNYTFVALACMILLIFSTALTPVLQIRLTAISAGAALQNIAEKAFPTVRQRELLARSQQEIDTIKDSFGGLISPLDALDTISKVIPDTAYLISLDLSNESSSPDIATVKLFGKSQNTLELINALTNSGMFLDLKLASPVVRQAGTSQETFSLTGNYKKQLLFEMTNISVSSTTNEKIDTNPKN